MDSLFLALSCYRRRKYEECAEHCSKILKKNPYDQGAWMLKTRALTQQVYIDEVEGEDQGIAEMTMDDNAFAQVTRPGTSLTAAKKNVVSTAAVRPVSQAGAPLTGYVRPGTRSGQSSSLEQSLRTPRNLTTARPVTGASGRFVRLGTASMLSSSDDAFINISRLNYAKYATKPALAKALFEYIFHHENDVRNALELAALATEAAKFKDWWWKSQLGKCYHRLGMFREAEQQYKSALADTSLVDTMLLLGKVYQRLDQPLQAVEVYQKGLDTFPEDVSLRIATARIYEEMNMTSDATTWYKDVLEHDGANVEAIASIAANFFYSDQPEIAIRLYRRLLQMGICNVELFNNLALSCYYAQHYDVTIKCFERALAIANDDQAADVWYNISHLALGVGDMVMAYQCLRLAVAADNGHAEAYNNLGVLELRRGEVERAKSLFRTSADLNPSSYEPNYNQASLNHSLGNLQVSYKSVLKAVECFPDHADSQSLLNSLQQHFNNL